MKAESERRMVLAAPILDILAVASSSPGVLKAC
jgi:hypothetical protein